MGEFRRNLKNSNLVWHSQTWSNRCWAISRGGDWNAAFNGRRNNFNFPNSTCIFLSSNTIRIDAYETLIDTSASGRATVIERNHAAT